MKTNYYTKALIEAFHNNATDVIEILLHHPEVDWNYRDKYVHMLTYASMYGDTSIIEKCLKDKKYDESNFLQSICNAAVKGKLDNIRLLVKYRENFNQNDSKFQYAIDSALRHAGEHNHIELFDYLLCLDANPNRWHVIYWTAKKAKKPMYDHLMKNILKLGKAPAKKAVIELCNCSRWSTIETEKLKGLIK